MTTWSDAFSGRTDHLLELVLTETATNPSGNTSTVVATLQINPPADSLSWSLVGDATYSMNFEGTTYTGSFTYDYRTNRATQVLRTVSKTVTHAASGAGNASAYGSANAGSGTLGTASITSKTLTLTDFVRLPSAPAAPLAITRSSDGVDIAITSAVASSPVTPSDYNFRYSTDDANWSAAQAMGADRYATMTGTPTASYYIQTRAYSSEGWGPWGASGFIAGIPTAPAAPTLANNSAGASVGITSQIPSSDATITDYNWRYSWDGSNWSAEQAMGTGRTATLSRTRTQPVWIQTRAYNGIGWGGWSATAFLAGAPTAPQAISLSRNARNVAVTISGSASNGGAAISAYTVQYSTNGGSTWTGTANISSGTYTYSSLTAGLFYLFRTYATNSTGDSATIAESIFVPAGGKRWDGTGWSSTATAKRWDGSAWVDLAMAKRWNGSAWIDLS